MVTAGDFRKGVTFEKDGQPCLIVDFQHVKPGKGAAFVRTKYKNLKTGAIREEAFNPSDKFPKALIETKQMQYLYDDGELYYFMDEETYDQIPLNYEQVEDAIKFLKENEVATIRFYQGQPFQVEAPNFAELTVTETYLSAQKAKELGLIDEIMFEDTNKGTLYNLSNVNLNGFYNTATSIPKELIENLIKNVKGSQPINKADFLMQQKAKAEIELMKLKGSVR